MRTIVLIGNCQAQAVVERLRRAYAEIEDVNLRWVPSYREVTPEFVEMINSAWLVCDQMGDFRQRALDSVHLGERPIAYFPVLSLSALWPASTRPHPHHRPTPDFPLGMFPGMQYCDEKANEIIRTVADPQEAFETYMSLNFATAFRLERLLDMNRTKLKNLGEKTGFDAWSLYEANLQHRRLHHTNLHPTNFVLDAVTDYLIERIDLPTVARERWVFDREEFCRNEVMIGGTGMTGSYWQMPIHPDVKACFGLDWYDDINLFRFEGDVSFRDYMRRYLTLALNVDLQAGANTIAQHNFDIGIAKLERGLAAAPNAYPAWHLLGMANWFLGRRDEAIAALERAAVLKPGNSTYATVLERVRAGEAPPIGIPVGDVTFSPDGALPHA
ncbi:WcbI family polysaccharide biosynthesis putative acetyltransferase [Labrys wisconsinensis]|uniref:Polysaccharide biosynthesis enzyme WcbI domain-containing protein n=1 Tax=Labrys wisconsinensis TaxID=425677 RepID=A0ABU0J173_9HYPH|nr:WcbI family polysaccharide biosynthesis putative acetyltransferase [Labrys wisconsinensis]MDQ0468010.1 hypothetical protein [Labrys wisconsinensis]